jgi:hypothetical protein
MHKYSAKIFCCICLLASSLVYAAKNSPPPDKCSYAKKPANCKTNSKENGCNPADSWINKPLPPYTAPATPNCPDNPPRPYALPMQGITYMWTLGGDVFFMYLEPKNSFSEIYRSNKVGGTIYLAQRFRNPFGYEFGLSYTDRKPKTLETVPGTVAFNTTATANAEDTGRVRIKITYLDLQAHTRLCKYIESKFILGIGWVRQGLENTYSPIVNTDPVQNAMRAMEGRTAWTVRLGIGAQALITDRIGCRAIILYENMSNIRYRNTPPGIDQGPFHDSISAAFGLYWHFLPLADPHNIHFSIEQ